MIRPKVLIVDDKPQNLYALEKLLQRLDVEVYQTTFGMDALGLALEHDFCVAIVDVQMPEMDGYELVELLRGNESTASLPVIFVSAIYSDEYHHQRGYDAGAVDFLSKPFVPEILLSKVQVFVDLFSQRQQLQLLVSQLNEANAALSRRALQLETSRMVAHRANSTLDLDDLLKEVVTLVSEKFAYYFVAIWLYADAEEDLILQAFAGEIGNQLPVGKRRALAEKGILVRVLQTGHSYLAADVTADAIYVPAPDLPHSRSELCLPLRVGDKVLGVLDIQCDTVAAFSKEDVSVLNLLADQIAIAMRNAQLYERVVRFNEALEIKVQERTEELEEAYRTLEMLDRNKSDFIEVVAHELRTPLSLVKGYGEMLAEEPEIQKTEMYRLQMEGIVTGANRMHEIVNTMLDMIKIDNQTLKLVPEPMAVGETISNLQESLAGALQERQLQMSVRDLQDLPLILADPYAMDKLFYQLIVNAIKYTPNGGQIMIYGRPLPPPEGAEQSEFVQVVVQDTGIGIDPEFHEMIFTKFYQTGSVTLHSSGKTKFKGGGPGLGLAIARGIVVAHGGRIWVESPGYDEENCPGTAFYVVLPIAFAGERDFVTATRELTESSQPQSSSAP